MTSEQDYLTCIKILKIIEQRATDPIDLKLVRTLIKKYEHKIDTIRRLH